MKKILFLLFLLPCFFNDVHANNIKPDYSWYADTIPLFKPGPYSAGDLVKDTYGTIWRARKDIKNAVSPPSYNSYWEPVKIAEPIPTPVPVAVSNNTIPGLLTTNTPEQNSAAIKKYIGSFVQGAAPLIYIPSGDYHFSERIELIDKPIHLVGDNGTMWGNGTRLFFPDGSDGIWYHRTAGFQEAIIENVCVIAQGKSIPWKSGVRSTGRITLRGVYVKGFSHNGIDIWANIEGEGTDASGSWIEKCFSSENGHDGFFAGRVDGNAITFIGCDARDNAQYGFNDDSFLGNTFISCMAHANTQGHYFVRDKGNARTNIIAAYCEGGSPASQLSTHTTVVGGIWASGYDLQDGKGIQYR